MKFFNLKKDNHFIRKERGKNVPSSIAQEGQEQERATGGSPAHYAKQQEHELLPLLQQMLRVAHEDRLESAIPFIEAMMQLVHAEHVGYGIPMGMMTVRGWIKLFRQWEHLLNMVSERQAAYLVTFFKELKEDPALSGNILATVLHELLQLMQNALPDHSSAATSQGEQTSNRLYAA